MLSESDVRHRQRRYGQVVLRALLIGMGTCLAFVLPLWPPTSDVFKPIGSMAGGLLLVLSVGSLLLILCLGERRAKKYSVCCPVCSAKITRFTEFLLATSCCRQCGERVLDIEPGRSPAVFERYQRLRQRRFLRLSLWFWPAMNVLTLLVYANDPYSMESCLHFLFLPALVGTAASCWAWLRTWHSGYLRITLISAVLLGVGGYRFWQAMMP